MRDRFNAVQGEWDAAAEWCARRGYRGVEGEPLPELISSEVHDYINEHPDEFEQAVTDAGYALAMERQRPWGREGWQRRPT